MENVKILYVRNLMLHTTEDTLEAEFSKHTGRGTIERVKKIRDYAFVHFNTRENALKGKGLLLILSFCYTPGMPFLLFLFKFLVTSKTKHNIKKHQVKKRRQKRQTECI